MTTEIELNQKWVETAANVLGFNNETSKASVAGGPAESVKLCLFATLVPVANHEEYMNKMTALHSELVKGHIPMISTRPSHPS